MPEFRTQAKISEHESGCQMILFSSFDCSMITEHEFNRVIDQAKQHLGPLPIVQIVLRAGQSCERELLEKMGFTCDGIKYQLSISRLEEILEAKHSRLPPRYQVRKFDFSRDIESLVKLEKEIHSADITSRVNFDTDSAVESMKNYYRRASAGDGVFVLMDGPQLLGVAAFMNNQKNDTCAHISSIGLALNLQGNGLFFPFLLTAFKMSPFRNRRYLNGVTTTKRLIAAAEKYGAETIGYSLTKKS
jgi:hypothetical protein